MQQKSDFAIDLYEKINSIEIPIIYKALTKYLILKTFQGVKVNCLWERRTYFVD